MTKRGRSGLWAWGFAFPSSFVIPRSGQASIRGENNGFKKGWSNPRMVHGWASAPINPTPFIMINTPRFTLPAALGVAALLAAAAPVPGARAERLLLLTNANGLVTVDSQNPGVALDFVGVTGLGAGETLVGADVRPANGALTAVSSASRLYSVNVATGATTAIGTGPFTPALQGTLFSLNFNPTVDRIRLVSEARQDLRLVPDTGVVVLTNGAPDGNETYAATDVNAAISPAVTGVAYTASGPNATVTQLYAIESAAGVLALQNPPNSGTLNTVGPLGVGANVQARGFDISNATERGYVNFVINNVPTLYSVNLATGASTRLGPLPTFFGTNPSVPLVPITGYNALTVPFQNVNRRQSSEGTVTKTQPLFASFTVGSALNPTAGSGSAVRVVIRGLGPTFGANGVANPQLRVFRLGANGAQTQIARNSGTFTAAEQAALLATGFAPAFAGESAVLLTLQPGSYAARLAPKRNTDQGNARIEVIELD